MKKLQIILEKITFPPVILRFFIIMAGFGGLATAFLTEKNGILLYIAETLSAYALIITVAWIVAIYGELYPKVKEKLYEISLVNRYASDHYFRVFAGLCLSLAVNLAFAGMKLYAAVFQSSLWMGAIAGYYIQLCLIRMFLTKQLLHAEKEKSLKREWEAYRTTAFLLFLTNLALSVIVTQIVREGKSYYYPGFVIYATAVYSFYSMGSSIYNFIRYNKWNSPLLSAVKTVSLTTALVSVFNLQTAMISSFGGEEEHTAMLNEITGGVVCIMVLIMAVFMLLRVGKKEKGDV